MVIVLRTIPTDGPAGATMTLLMSRKLGTASVTITLSASAVPLLLTTSVKTIVSPIEAVDGSPDLVTAGSTTVAAPGEVLGGGDVSGGVLGGVGVAVGVLDDVAVSVGVFDGVDVSVGVFEGVGVSDGVGVSVGV